MLDLGVCDLFSVHILRLRLRMTEPKSSTRCLFHAAATWRLIGTVAADRQIKGYQGKSRLSVTRMVEAHDVLMAF